MNLLFIDTETTGLSPTKHEAFEIAFAIMIDGVTHIKATVYARPEKPDNIEQEALNVNGWTRERLALLPEKRKAWLAIKHFFGLFGDIKYTIVEHSKNGNFDCQFLKEFIDREYNGYSLYKSNFNRVTISTLAIAKKRLPHLKSYRLKDVARALGIPVDESKLHGAAYDRDLMILVYRTLGGAM